jgi:hypothetical protein
MLLSYPLIVSKSIIYVVLPSTYGIIIIIIIIDSAHK